MNRFLCVNGTIMVGRFLVVVGNKWFTEYKLTMNRVLVFHTKQGIILHRKEGRG